MKKKATSKKVVIKRPKTSRPKRDPEEDYYYNELKRKSEIMNEIVDFLRFRNDYITLEEADDYFVVAKFSYLSIKNTFNDAGFQPLDKVTNAKECLVRVIEFGEEPSRNTIAYLLKRGGCPVISPSRIYHASCCSSGKQMRRTHVKRFS